MKQLMNKFSNYMEYYARARSRQILLTLSDRQLEDAGISKELVLKGTSAWPWRVEDQFTTTPKQPDFSRLTTASPAPVTGEEYKQAVQDLESMSDRELLDVGITRGEIRHAVRYGVEDKVA